MRADALQHRKANSKDGRERQKRCVDQAGRAQAEVALFQITPDGQTQPERKDRPTYEERALLHARPPYERIDLVQRLIDHGVAPLSAGICSAGAASAGAVSAGFLLPPKRPPTPPPSK